MKITSNISIEELMEILPEAVTYLSKKEIRCIRCGEPIWGTLEEASREKGFDDDEIKQFVQDLNELYESVKQKD